GGRGGGGFVSSVSSEDTASTADVVLGIAPYHGRVFLGSAKIAEASPGPGTVLPLLVHGGPGRAGGGEELGGLRGLAFYMQRVALEGSRPVIDRLLKEFPNRVPGRSLQSICDPCPGGGAGARRRRRGLRRAGGPAPGGGLPDGPGRSPGPGGGGRRGPGRLPPRLAQARLLPRRSEFPDMDADHHVADGVAKEAGRGALA